MYRVLEFVDDRGRAPFRRWFDSLEPQVAGRIAAVLYRMEQGNLANARPLGEGLHEYRLDAGPGYRVYFCRIGTDTLLLVGGGTKRTQRRDIDAGRRRWQAFQQRQDDRGKPDGHYA